MARPHVGLAHARLSILDPTDAGAQPMCRNGTWIVHNGEIYNFVELAAELAALGHRFSTRTDTEVILAAYREWGTSAAQRFNGMWAFALWDEARRRLWLSRDRLGVKPLYLRRAGRRLAFASEIGALLEATPMHPDDGWRPEPHLGAVRDFLVRGLVDHSPQTFYAGITALSPGHSMVVEPDGERLERYWTPPPLTSDAEPPGSASDATDARLVEEFAERFTDSVRLRLRADVPIGTCLSGGLDSSSIVVTVSRALAARPAGAASNEQQPRVAFHARYPDDGVDESRYADLAARASGMSMIYRSVAMTPFLDRLDDVLRRQGEPFNGTSVFAQWTVMQAAHGAGLKVLLDGQGADELLGGYLPYVGVRAAGLARSGDLVAGASELRAAVRTGVLSPGAALRGLVRGAVPAGVNELARAGSRGAFGVRVAGPLAQAATLARADHRSGTALARRLWQDVSSEMLPALLRYEDRNSMAFAIESRVPFLDYRLVELALRLPDRLKISRGVTKAVLRRAMRERLPSEIADRRDKIGFATPQARWLRAAVPEARSVLVGGAIVRRGWVGPTEVERLLAQPGRGDGVLLWRLVVLEQWLRQHRSWS